MYATRHAAARHNARMHIWIVPLVAVVILTAIVLGIRHERARAKKLLGAIVSGGYPPPTFKPSETERQSIWALLAPLHDLRTGAKGLTWFTAAQRGPTTIVLAEHRYVVSTGKSSHAVYHAIAATSCPASWPKMLLAEESWLDKIGAWLGSRDVQVEDPAFNSRWRVSCDAPDFALVFLTPEVQSLCQRLPKGTALRINGGGMVLVRRSRPDPDWIVDHGDWLAAIARTVPPELQSWGA